MRSDPFRSGLHHPFSLLLAALLPTVPLRSATIDFSSTAGSGSNWGNNANWIGGTAPANDLTSDIARFDQSTYANQPNPGTSRSVAGLIVGDGTTATAALTMGGTALSLGSSGIDMQTAAGAATINTTTLTLGADQTWNNASASLLTVTGTIGGAFSIEKTGDGALSLTGGSYSGGLTLTDGNLRINGNSAAGTGTFALNGGTLSVSGSSARTLTNTVTVGGDIQLGVAGISGLTTLSGAITVNGDRQLTFTNTGVALTGGLTLAGNLTLSTDIATLLAAGGNTIAASIGETGAPRDLVKTGSGIIALSGANTYSGGTTLASGQLWAGSASALGTGTVTFTGGTLDLRNFALVTNALDGSAGTITNTASAATTVLTVGQGGGGGTFAGTFTQSVGTKIIALAKTGSGTQVLSGVNAYTGATTVSAGTLQFTRQVSLYNNGAAAAWSAANIIVNSGATLALNVGGTGEFTEANINTLLGLSTSTGGFKDGSLLGLDTTNAAGGAFTFTSTLANPNGGANSLGLVKLGSGTLTFLAAGTFTGDVFIRAGILSFQNPSIAATASVSLSSGTTLNLNFAGTDTVSSLTLGGQGTVAGTYGRIGSGAEFESAFLTGDGLLDVTLGTAAIPEPSAFVLLSGLAALLLSVTTRRRAA